MTKTKCYQKPIHLMVALALVLSLGIVAVPLAGTVGAQTERHVAINCTGIPSPCYTSIQAAINASALGDTIRVHPGKYNENLIINKSLTLQSTDGWEDTNIDPLGDSIIIISGDVDVTVQGFEITAGTHGIYIGPVFSTVNILDCFIHDNLIDGIHVESAGDQLNIERNIVSENGISGGGCGIYMSQAWNTTNILDNIIGAWWGGEVPVTTYVANYNDGIDIDDVPVGADVVIEGNHIVANGTVVVAADHGINLDSVAGNVNIRDNVIGAWTYDYGGATTVYFTGNKNHGIHVGKVSDTGSVTIEGNAISENGHDGINFGQGAGAILGNVAIRDNFIGGWTCYSGDYGYSGDEPPRYQGNGGEGIYMFQVGEAETSGTVTIEDNKISENARLIIDTGITIGSIYGVVTIAENDIGAWEDDHGENYTGNGGQGILVNNVYSGAELTIGPDNSIKENTSHGIDILWGQSDSSIEIHHNFIDDPVVDGCGIKLGSAGVCGATISNNTIVDNYEGIHLDANSQNTTIQNNEIRDNGHGIWVEGDNNQILRNDILNNKMLDSGIHLTSTASGNTIHCNNIAGNSHSPSYGVYNDANEVVDATNNWWGHASGPSGMGPGIGDPVSKNVTYAPWLSTQFQYCPECGGAPPVGGEAHPVNKLAILAPWIALIAAIIAGASLVVLRRRKAQR
jgi:parallel beta-helix repeat protein